MQANMYSLAAALLLAALLPAAAPAPAERLASPVVTFQVGFPDYRLRHLLGEVSGVAVRHDGHSVLFHRADRAWGDGDFDEHNKFTKIKDGPIEAAPIVEIDQRGQAVNTYGEKLFYLPHGITVDRLGKMWTTDVARHQVMRIDPKTEKVDLVIGEKFVPGSDEKHLCKPTKVAVASNGDFFVADGYCNHRVVKFDKDGKFIGQFGRKPAGKDLKEDELAIPHGLALMERLDLICVADREHRRVQCYRAGLHNAKDFGKFVQSVDSELGRVFDVAFLPTGELLILHIQDEKQLSLVSIYNLEASVTVDKFTFVPDSGDLDEQSAGFGRAHTIAAAPTGQFALIGSLDAICDHDDIYCAYGYSTPYQVFRFNIQEPRKM